MKRRKLTRAPFLIGRTARVRLYNRLPDEIKEGLRDIARSERKSMSWVVEEMIIDYCHLSKPKYMKPREKN